MLTHNELQELKYNNIDISQKNGRLLFDIVLQDTPDRKSWITLSVPQTENREELINEIQKLKEEIEKPTLKFKVSKILDIIGSSMDKVQFSSMEM